MRAGRAALLCIALLGAGCSTGEKPTATDPAPTPAELPAVPHPDLSELETLVQTELRKGQDELDLALRNSQLSKEELSKVYGRTGMRYHAYQLTAAAEVSYLNAQTLDNDELRWPYYLGHLYRRAGRLEESLQQFMRVLESSPDDLATLIEAAELEQELNRNDAARRRFRQALELDRDSVPALEGLGKIALAAKEYDEAVRLFERALSLAPRATAINYPLGLAYRGVGEMERARELLANRGNARVRVPDPRMEEVERLAQGWRVLQNRGTSLISAGLYREALAEFRLAEAAAPDQSSVQVNIGAALQYLGDLEGAYGAMRRAVELDPEEVTARFNLGVVSARMGRDQESVDHYRKAIELNPDYTDAHFNLANGLRRLGRIEASIAPYRRVINDDPANEMARLGEIFALVRLERYAEARRRLEEGLHAIPQSRHLRNGLARVLAAAPDGSVRDGDRALETIQPLIEAERSLPDVVALAMALAEFGDFATAAKWQESAIEAVRRAERPDLLVKLQKDLDGYRQGRPCREPWSEDDPALAPPSLKKP